MMLFPPELDVNVLWRVRARSTPAGPGARFASAGRNPAKSVAIPISLTGGLTSLAIRQAIDNLTRVCNSTINGCSAAML
jgi:hypothetical protein